MLLIYRLHRNYVLSYILSGLHRSLTMQRPTMTSCSVFCLILLKKHVPIQAFNSLHYLSNFYWFIDLFCIWSSISKQCTSCCRQLIRQLLVMIRLLQVRVHWTHHVLDLQTPTGWCMVIYIKSERRLKPDQPLRPR